MYIYVGGVCICLCVPPPVDVGGGGGWREGASGVGNVGNLHTIWGAGGAHEHETRDYSDRQTDRQTDR